MTTTETVIISSETTGKKTRKETEERKIIRKRERRDLKDSYIKHLIRSSILYTGDFITSEMIQEKREKVIIDRIIRRKKEEMRKTQEEGYVFYVDKEFR